MKAFEKRQKQRSVKTIGFLTFSGAYEFGEKEGWKAALEWITEESYKLNESLHGLDICTLHDLIDKELED